MVQNTLYNNYIPREAFFIQKVRKVIEEKMNEKDFGIIQLCKILGISRSQLHNKIKRDTGMSTSIYIRKIRLERAKILLLNTDWNISEVAYEVGFNDPSFFSRTFSGRFGISPSKIRFI